MTAPISPSALPPSFPKASGHHYGTARLSEARRLRISADHLACLSAECAIKAIPQDYLGSRLNTRNRLFSPELMARQQSAASEQKQKKQDDKEYNHEHLPGPWGQLSTVAQKRTGRGAGPQFMQLLQRNPFHDRHVARRYCDDSTIAQADLDRHLSAARALIAAHEQASILGTGTLA